MANLAPDDTSAAGLLALNRARTVAEGRAAAALITSPPQNVMMADSAGGIAVALTGLTPIRRAGNGTLPVPGADGAHDWTGWVPFDAMPHAANPPGGALANANNRVSPPGHPVFLGRDWFGDWRFRRIGEMLAARPRHDAPGFAAMQRDTVSLLARELVAAPDAILRKAPRPEGAAGTAHDLLLAWDGNIAADRPEPLLFNAWMRAARRLALAEGGAPPGRRPVRNSSAASFRPTAKRRRALVRRRLRRPRHPRAAGSGRGAAGRPKAPTPPPGAGAASTSRASSTRSCASSPCSAPGPASKPRPAATSKPSAAAGCGRRRPSAPGSTSTAPACGWWPTCPTRTARSRSSPPASPATRSPPIGATCCRPGGTAAPWPLGRAPEGESGRFRLLP